MLRINQLNLCLHRIRLVQHELPPTQPKLSKLWILYLDPTRVHPPPDNHPPGPLPQQAAAQAPGQGRGHLVGHPRQAPAHAQEGCQGEVVYFYPIIIAKQSVAFVTKSSR